jgi:hypothetical protein
LAFKHYLLPINDIKLKIYTSNQLYLFSFGNLISCNIAFIYLYASLQIMHIPPNATPFLWVGGGLHNMG